MRYLRLITTIVFAAMLALWLVLSVSSRWGEDTVCPVITADTDQIEVSVSDGLDVLTAGMTATDDKDGDITDRIIVGKQTKFVQKGTSEVTFLVFDSSNNVGSYTRTVTYRDYESPKFTLDRELVYGAGNSVQVLDRLSVVDAIQGDISDKLKIVSSTVNRSKPGTYEMGVEASNRFGDLVSVKLPIQIVETRTNVPVIALSEYLVYLKPGETLDAESYLKSVTLTDDTEGELANVQIESSVNSQAEGSYQVLYSYTDENEKTGYSSLTVIVKA